MSVVDEFVEESNIPRTEWERLIDEWIFSERDRAILKRSLLDGVTYEKIAEEFDLSTRQVSRIIPKATTKLFKHVNVTKLSYK